MDTALPAPVSPAIAVDGAAGSRAMAGVWFATAVFSTGPVLISTTTATGPVLSFWRMWMGVPLLGGVAAVHAVRTGRRPTRRGLRLAALGGVAFAVHQATLMSALRVTTVVDVALMNALGPVIVAVLAVRLFGERPGTAFRLWSAVAVAGAVLVAFLGSTGVGGHPAGMALAAANVAFYSCYFAVSKQARPAIDTWPFLAVTFTVAALCVSLFVLVAGFDLGAVTGHDLAVALFVAVGPGLVGHGTMTWSLRYVPANVPPVVMLTIPLFSGLLAYGFLGQGVTLAKVAAGAITIVGVLGAMRSPLGAEPAVVEAMALAEET